MPISRQMDKKAVVHIHNGILLSHLKEYIWINSNEVDETGPYYTEWSKSERKHQYSILMHIYGIYKDGSDNPICETPKETQMYRIVFWTLWERERVGWFGRMTLKHVYYHMWNESPVQVWCMRQGAQGWCTGITQKDGMGREVGGGFRMGNTCTPVVDSCQCMAKPL